MAFFEQLITDFFQFVQNNLWFAPLSAFLLPFLEALFPWLPLTALVSFNLSIMSGIYGAGAGTLYTVLLSVAGSFLGMFGIFLFIRATLAKYFIRKVESNPFGKKFIGIIDKKNMGLALMLLCNPFLPSSIMNYGMSLTKVNLGKYVFLTGVSRIAVILFIVFLGSVFNIQEHPWNVAWMMLAYLIVFGIVAIVRILKNKSTSKSPQNGRQSD